jgi:hypothetical protein
MISKKKPIPDFDPGWVPVFGEDHAQIKVERRSLVSEAELAPRECAMLDHVSITVSDIAAAERFYDAIMKALGVVKVGSRENWLGYGERAEAAYPDRVFIAINKGPTPGRGLPPALVFQGELADGGRCLLERRDRGGR